MSYPLQKAAKPRAIAARCAKGKAWRRDGLQTRIPAQRQFDTALFLASATPFLQ
jgi:hypothetical protein